MGWGLVELTEEKYDVETADGTVEEKYKICGGEIIGTGVRTFKTPHDDKGKSLALKRGLARRSRWTTRRKARRLNRLIELGREYDLIGEGFDRDRF